MQSPFLQEPLPVTESLLRAVKHFTDTRYYWNNNIPTQTWTSVSEQKLFPLEQKAVALWAGAPCQLFWELGTGWEGCTCLRSHSFGPGQPCCSSAAEECSDHCGSLLLLQLGVAPASPCGIYPCGQGCALCTCSNSKKKATRLCFIRFKVMGVTLSSHKNKGIVDVVFTLFCQGLFLLRVGNQAELVSQAKRKRPE